MSIRSYSQLSQLKTFKERYEYLRLDGSIGKETFGFDRYINQKFYKFIEWVSVRDQVIMRDCGCDLGMSGYEIYGKILIHHMNVITVDDIKNRSDILLNPEYLITTVLRTHNAIHYGSDCLLTPDVIERSENDTCLWRH